MDNTSVIIIVIAIIVSALVVTIGLLIWHFKLRGRRTGTASENAQPDTHPLMGTQPDGNRMASKKPTSGHGYAQLVQYPY